MATFVAVAHVELRMPWVRSLKEKRSLVTPIVEGARRRYPVAVARVDGHDTHGRERLAVVSVGTDPDALRGTLAAVERLIAAGGVEVAWSRVDVERWDDGEER